MIILDVEEYCQECPAFETVTLNAGKNSVIRCQNRGVCDLIKKHLEKTMETETGDDKHE